MQCLSNSVAVYSMNLFGRFHNIYFEYYSKDYYSFVDHQSARLIWNSSLSYCLDRILLYLPFMMEERSNCFSSETSGRPTSPTRGGDTSTGSHCTALRSMIHGKPTQPISPNKTYLQKILAKFHSRMCGCTHGH